VALAFARKVVGERGRVNDDDVEALRAVGFNDGEITEIVGNVAVNLFTNYLNHVAETEVDFPAVDDLRRSAACTC
jgi:alkylhydroperoxidase family enzyme